MGFLKEYEERKKIDEIVWKSLPTIMGYWHWFFTTLYFWHFRSTGIDLSATIGLGIGIVAWVLTHLLLGILGINLIHMNLWDNCGCGCLARVIAIPLLPYAGILALSIWVYNVGSLGILESIIGMIIGWTNWFLISYLDTY